MNLDVLIFGAAATQMKSDRICVSVGDRPTVREVLVALCEQHPELRFALPAPGDGRLAVNHSFASGEQPIHPGDEVALVTLVAGG